MEPEKGLPLSDAPGFYSHLPVFNMKVLKSIKVDLENSVEILPLKNFFAINIVNILDCIDYQKSEYITFPDGKRILRFKKYFSEGKALKDKIFLKLKKDHFQRLLQQMSLK